MSLLSNIFGGKAKGNASVDFEVSLHCGKCVKRVEDVLSENKGIASSSVNLESKLVSISYDDRKTSEEDLKKSIEGLGFEVIKK